MALGTSVVAYAVESPAGRGGNTLSQEAVTLSTVQVSNLTHRAFTTAPSAHVLG